MLYYRSYIVVARVTAATYANAFIEDSSQLTKTRLNQVSSLTDCRLTKAKVKGAVVGHRNEQVVSVIFDSAQNKSTEHIHMLKKLISFLLS